MWLFSTPAPPQTAHFSQRVFVASGHASVNVFATRRPDGTFVHVVLLRSMSSFVIVAVITLSTPCLKQKEKYEGLL